MARFKLLVGLVACTALISACEKAKMKTVAPSDTKSVNSAAPDSDITSTEDDQSLESENPTDVDTSEKTVHLSDEDPAKDQALNDDPEFQDLEVIDPALEKTADDHQGREDQVARTEREPKILPPVVEREPVHRQVQRRVVMKKDCPPCCRTQRRPPPVIQEPVGFVLGDDDLHCRWEPQGRPMVYLRYSPISRVAFVKYGYPAKWARFENVQMTSGLPPYGDLGLSLLTRAGLPIASLRPRESATIWNDSRTTYPYEARFGEVPFRINGNTRGVCWTKQEPSKTINR